MVFMRLVTAAIIISKGKVLIARREPGDTGEGFWEFPGGVVEPGETLQQCLERELMEELGVTAEIGETIAESVTQDSRGYIKLVALGARITGGEITPTAHDRVEWVSPGELESYGLSAPDIPIAKLLAKRSDLQGK
jgi:mutator protein MutT